MSEATELAEKYADQIVDAVKRAAPEVVEATSQHVLLGYITTAVVCGALFVIVTAVTLVLWGMVRHMMLHPPKPDPMDSYESRTRQKDYDTLVSGYGAFTLIGAIASIVLLVEVVVQYLNIRMNVPYGTIEALVELARTAQGK